MNWQHAIEQIAHITLTPGKPGPCPMCGGDDRFVYDDKNADGTWYCRQCGGRDQKGGSGNGFELIKRLLSCDYARAVELVVEHDQGAGYKQPERTRPQPKQVFPATLPAPQPGVPVKLLSAKTGVSYAITPELVTPITTPSGATHGWVVRYIQNGKKLTPQITQVKTDEGMALAAMGIPEPRPLLTDWSRAVPGQAVLVVEGEKTMVAAQRLFPDLLALTWIGGAQAVGKSDWSALLRALGESPEIYIIPDNDEPGKRAAAEVSARTGGVVVDLDWHLYPAAWDVADPLPAGVPADGVRKAISKAAEKPAGVVTLTDKPLDLLGTMEPPELPAGLLPGVIARYALDQSAIVGTDPGMMAATCLVAVASVIDDAVTLQPKASEPGWRESARLWCAIVADPAAKKTPAMSAALRPLRRIDARMAEEHARVMASHMDEVRAYKALPPKERALREPPRKPPESRVRVNGTTIEALEHIMVDNPRGLLCEYDELAGWFGRMDAYSAGGAGSKDRPAWLELYNGGMRRSDTVGRGSVVIPNWSSCVIGAIQPDVFRKIADKLPTDGLLQRFFCIVGRKAKTDQDRPAVESFAQDYGDLIADLHALRWVDSSGRALAPLYLSPEAAQERKAFFAWAHALLESGAVRGPMAGFVGKWEGFWSRLVVVYHMVSEWDRITGQGLDEMPAGRVEVDTARMVSGLIRHWILPHSMIVYQDILGSLSGDDVVRSVARCVLTWELPEIANRDLLRRCRDWRTAPEWRRAEVSRVLEDGGWWVGLERGAGDRMASRWRINASISAEYATQAEQERVRRETARDALRSISDHVSSIEHCRPAPAPKRRVKKTEW